MLFWSSDYHIEITKELIFSLEPLIGSLKPKVAFDSMLTVGMFLCIFHNKWNKSILTLKSFSVLGQHLTESPGVF